MHAYFNVFVNCFSGLCNDWILLVLRDHVSKAELNYFIEHLLPVTVTLRVKGLVIWLCAVNKMSTGQ